jgi:SPP1 gp7 family putative phage head morphogenesis protein
MPTVPRQRPTRVRTGRPGAPAQIENAEVSPQEVAAIRSSVQGKEQAPSSRQQVGANVNWNRVRDQLGDPFEVERIPLSRLRLMRRDPMLSFGLSFIKTPFARAKWYINARDSNGPNAEVAANVDWALRRIFASFVFQWSNILDFGFSGMAKRYEERMPTGTYIATDPNTGEKTDQPLWSQGNIKPVIWKPFIALAPEVIEPIWTGGGDFNGILYNQQNAPASIGAVQQGDQASFKIDVYHALWATHAKEENFGSIFGFPRLGHAFQYWWSYWFRWAIADRAFEKKADPSTIVRHPDGSFLDSGGNEISHREYALEMGERMRSGDTIAMPSEVYMGEIDGKPSGIRMWDIEFTKEATDFDPFDKSFDYLDIQKLRSLWIPEQAFLEGKGGTSSRNVAKEMGESFTESQAVLASQLMDLINRWVIPQFLAINFPEFMAANGTAEIVMQGFADQDVEARNEIIQLIGQQPVGAQKIMSLVDLGKMLDDAGMPLLPYTEQKRVEAEVVKAMQAAQGPAAGVTPVPGSSSSNGSVGVVPTSTGFSYIQPREVIYLSDSSSSFVERLPSTHQYHDSAVRRSARELWQEWYTLYGEEYRSFADFLAEQDAVEFADIPETVRKQARKLVKAWEENNDRLGKVLDRTTGIYKKVMDRAAKLESKRAKLDGTPDEAALEQWITNHAAEFVSNVSFTTREELTDFIATRINAGMTDVKALATEVREHFNEFPGWKADRLARSEIRDAYNAATLLAAQANGVDSVQAIDGTDDPICKERNGKIFNITDAFLEREHPNGTLGWRILPVELSWRYADDDFDMPEGVNGLWDKDTNTVIFSQAVTDEERSEFLLTVGGEVAA